jgi:hypothetical protein
MIGNKLARLGKFPGRKYKNFIFEQEAILCVSFYSLLFNSLLWISYDHCDFCGKKSIIDLRQFTGVEG